MIAERDPEALVRAMAEQEVPPEPKEVREARREHTVAALSRAIRQSAEERERRSRLRRRLAMFSAVAALVLGVVGAQEVFSSGPVAQADAIPRVGVVESVSGTLVVTHSGRSRVVAAGERPALVAGDELRTATDGVAKLQTERSAVQVAPATHLRLLAPSSAEERIRIALGRVDLHVSKQAEAPRSVVVETPNADVVVRGTVFSVSVEEERGQPNTRVRVTEGSVWVLSKGSRDLVSSGEEWSSLAPRKAQVSVPAPIPAPEVAVQPRPIKRSAPARTTREAPPKATLAEENRMFQAAIDVRNRGDDRRAIELFGGLLSRYPKGHLAEEARVERMRALRRLGESGKASAEARRYLSEHGGGFAREEARDAALGGK